jgi:hypothetical protein
VLLAAGEATSVGGPTPRLSFGEQKRPDGAGLGRRVLFLDQKPAFELSWWCGRCQFLFRRLDGANDTLSVADLRQRLTAGLDGLDEGVIASFAALLARGSYLRSC